MNYYRFIREEDSKSKELNGLKIPEGVSWVKTEEELDLTRLSKVGLVVKLLDPENLPEVDINGEEIVFALMQKKED